ncbi:MAG: hypothetical protein ACI8TX_002165 [Hyphomicrobiaceae bacterium]
MAGVQGRGNIAALDDGSFLIAWVGRDQLDDGSTDVFARRYRSDLTADGPEFRINSDTLGEQGGSDDLSAASLGNGRYVVAWASHTDDVKRKPYDIYGQILCTIEDSFETCGDVSCDVKASGGVFASDALRVLKAAVGDSIVLNCPQC